MKTKLNMVLASALATALSACGGGGGGSNTATGIFKDSNVGGMTYTSGSITGVTGADGSFTYERGQPVTFSLGGVVIGTADGKEVVTPVDLVASGSSTSPEVLNIVRFFIMLDSDADPSNGISISPEV